MPMNERNTWLRPAIACRSESASLSPRAAGRSSGRGRMIDGGTVCATSSSRLWQPIVASICAISSSFGPMCRSGKVSVGRRGSDFFTSPYFPSAWIQA